MFTEVANGEIIGELFNLSGSYQLQDGRTICGIEYLSAQELLDLGIYEIIEEIPAYNQSWQGLGERTFTVNERSVALTYAVEDMNYIYPSLLQARLEGFAKEKDIDFNEIGLLTQSPNLTWKAEAEHLTKVYTDSWEIFYANSSKTWDAIEKLLPDMVWL